jgi:hypothetical protein
MIPAVIERCAGIDVGRKFLDVCVMTGDAHDVPAEHQQSQHHQRRVGAVTEVAS